MRSVWAYGSDTERRCHGQSVLSSRTCLPTPGRISASSLLTLDPAPSYSVQIFGARKMVESRVVGFQNDEKYGLIFRCIQCCDGEWLDLPEGDVLEGMQKFEFNKDLKALKNEITMAVDKIPTDVDVDNDGALNNWLIGEVQPLVQIQER